MPVQWNDDEHDVQMSVQPSDIDRRIGHPRANVRRNNRWAMLCLGCWTDLLTAHWSQVIAVLAIGLVAGIIASGIEDILIQIDI